MTVLPTFADVEAAAGRLAGHAVRTPLLRSDKLDEITGGRIYAKAENLQRTGSFKFRGAWNTVSQLPADVAARGVVACSSGNHAQGVALAAAMLGIDATIVMPSDAPAVKRGRTAGHGARVVEYDRFNDDRDAIAAAIASKTDATFVHPYEHPHVIAGQGTAGLEMAQQMAKLGEVPDHVLTCAGGGGLMAGVLLATTETFPEAKVHPVEPLGFDDQRRSHMVGTRVGNDAGASSICDAVLTAMPGENSFAICNGRVGEGLVVSDDEALAAVAFAFHEMRIVLEPGGAIALAAVLHGKLNSQNKCVALTLSGGNVDADIFQRALAL